MELNQKNYFVEEELVIVYTEACVCVTLHDCKVGKHTSLPIYEQAEGGVNQARTVQLSAGPDTQLFTLFSEPRRVPVKAFFLNEKCQ